MGVLRIMSVGKSGVGKSTIGNCLISGDPWSTDFETNCSPNSCTQQASSKMSKDCSYCDVPGIPDTNVENTKDFYDILIKEARKELNVILFLFKYERIDNDDYTKAKMLFRELKKSNAMKILVINDTTNHNAMPPDKRPTEKEYKKMEASIKEITGLEFQHVISMTFETMIPSMNNLKILLSETKSHKSPSLKTYVELKEFVAGLKEKKNHEEVVYAEAIAEIEKIKTALNILEGTAIAATAAATAATAAAFFTFGATLGIATPTLLAAAAAKVAIEIKRTELSAAQLNVTQDKIIEAKEKLEAACSSFDKLDAALTVAMKESKK